MKKKVTAVPAWCITLAATLDLVVLVLMSASDAQPGSLAALAVCEVILIVGAVASWQRYFAELIDEKTKQQ